MSYKTSVLQSLLHRDKCSWGTVYPIQREPTLLKLEDVPSGSAAKIEVRLNAALGEEVDQTVESSCIKPSFQDHPLPFYCSSPG
jgi:hypothetical protein